MTGTAQESATDGRQVAAAGTVRTSGRNGVRADLPSVANPIRRNEGHGTSSGYGMEKRGNACWPTIDHPALMTGGPPSEPDQGFLVLWRLRVKRAVDELVSRKRSRVTRLRRPGGAPPRCRQGRYDQVSPLSSALRCIHVDHRIRGKEPRLRDTSLDHSR